MVFLYYVELNFLREIGNKFYQSEKNNGDFNIKKVLSEIIRSDYFLESTINTNLNYSDFKIVNIANNRFSSI